MTPESPDPNASTPQVVTERSSTASQAEAKRKAESNSGTHTRAKRNRYISIACNECKRRKIKCNGQVPCQRCAHLNLECLYAPNCCNGNFKDSEEFRSMTEQISTLQEQVDTLFTNLSELGSQKSSLEALSFDPSPRVGSRSASLSVNRPRMKHPRFHGPTSSAFNFDVARSSLENMGIASTEDALHDTLMTTQVTPADSPPQVPAPMAATSRTMLHPSKDPIWAIKREEAERLCRVYEDEIGLMYPFFDFDKIISQTSLLYTFLEAAVRTGFTQRGLAGMDSVQDDESIHLKMILATTLILEGHGQNELAARLYENVKPVFYQKMLEPADIKSIQLFTIIAIYHFHTDDDIMAYRIIGLAARMCLELGLHRRDAVMRSFPSESDRLWVSKIFWSIYILDRRWSFGTGLPFVFQDDDIDPTLPEPDDSLPYLKSMVAFNHISSKIWYSGLGYEASTDVKRDEIGFLDYQVCQWYKNIPETLKFPAASSGNGNTASRGLQRLRVILYLRMNQLRILIYRPIVHSASSILENRSHAQTVVDIAKDTINVLTRLNQTSDIYRTQQICFNYFLVAALAVLFLAVCHDPAEFSRQVRDEFYQSLNLVNGFSTKSHISKRLWKTIRGIRKIAEKLGVFPRNVGPDAADPHSSAAVAMAGLAGHSIEDLSVYGNLRTMTDLDNSPMNGLQMSHELTNLFEAVGGYGHYMTSSGGPESLHGFDTNDADLRNSGEGLAGILSSEAEFSRALRDLF